MAADAIAAGGVFDGTSFSGSVSQFTPLGGTFTLGFNGLREKTNNPFSTVNPSYAGGLQPGEPYTYRVQGPTFLIEYDNTQNSANHIHCVWRDFNGDFGRDLLDRQHPQPCRRELYGERLSVERPARCRGIVPIR